MWASVLKLCAYLFSGLYFSAHWCPPCRGFTPELATFYNTATGQGDKFEIIFVSCDRDEPSFKDYFGSMPWAALKFEHSDIKVSVWCRCNDGKLIHVLSIC